jgi:tRNA dimethylallyltransferase
MRALEVVEETGKSIMEFRSGKKTQHNFDVVKIALNWQREILYNRINQRVDKMLDEGLENEARHLYPHRSLNALQTVGYSELFDYFDHKISLPEAIEKIKTNTRRYAKRQLTWFRKDKDFHWFEPSEKEKIISFIQSKIA